MLDCKEQRLVLRSVGLQAGQYCGGTGRSRSLRSGEVMQLPQFFLQVAMGWAFCLPKLSTGFTSILHAKRMHL